MLRNIVIKTRQLQKRFFNAPNVTRRSLSNVAKTKPGLFGSLAKNSNQRYEHKFHRVLVANSCNGGFLGIRYYAKKKTAQVEASDAPVLTPEQPPVTPNPIVGFAQVSQVQIPHPNKFYKGGEDACFISKDKSVLAVFDGVGGFASPTLDPRDYAVKLAEGGKKIVDTTTERDPKKILEAAYIEAKSTKGGSTACVAVLNGNKVHMANLGDSGMLIIRPPNNSLFRSVAQQERFNCPFILPHDKDKAHLEEIIVAEGDIVIVATDGVFDNLFDEGILAIVEKILNVHKSADDLAQRVAVAIANQASLGGHGKANKTPWRGGKLDDVTITVGIVGKVPVEAEKDQATDAKKSKGRKSKAKTQK